MKVTDGLHAFLWTSPSANNCNTYLIDGPARILIDPGHLHLFEHVEVQLRVLGIEISDIDLVLVTHATRITSKRPGYSRISRPFSPSVPKTGE